MRRILTVAALCVSSICCNLAIPPHPDPQDYAQDCTSDSDCVAVAVKDCSQTACNCGYAGAINRRDEQRFNEDESRTVCVRPPPLFGMCNCADFRVAACRDGTCTLVAFNSPDAGSP